MYSAYKLNTQGDNIQFYLTPFPVLNQSVVPCLILTVASWLVYKFLRRPVRSRPYLISIRIFHSLLWSYNQKLSHSQWSRNIYIYFFPFFLEFPCSLEIQWILTTWFLVLLPFLNPACISESSQFTYCWSIAWRILSITLVACEMSTILL